MADMTDNEMDYTPDLITLLDEDDNEHEFEVIDSADVDDEHYLALVPYNADPVAALEEEAEMIIMRVDVDEENEEYLSIVGEDEEELYRVSRVFAKRLEEYFDIEE